jgi:signal peptidase I
MSRPAHSVQRSLAAVAWLVCRRCLCVVILILFALVVLQTLAVEAFHIPTGSMAPTLHGHHRVCACPRCGQEVVVGRHAADRDGSGQPRFYRKAFCPNCGLYPIPLAKTQEIPGDRILVNKTSYLVRPPARWEIIVFRLLGTFYIKRLLGLPGEEILIHDGDLYVNGRLHRKTLEEARPMRVLVFDQKRAPKESGWRDRWETDTPFSPSLTQGEKGAISLDGRLSPCMLTYRHFLLDTGKCEPMRDEYAYNGGLDADSECVHDFLIEAEIEASAGRGSLALRLCDGRDWVEVVLPVGVNGPIEAFAWPIDAPEQVRKLADTEKSVALRAKQRCRVELAFVDRRLTLALNGQVCLSADLRAAKKRQGVARPFQARADGVEITLHGFRLYRDVHYGQQGNNAVRGKSVRLGVDQYFLLGDNSPNSEDSRFWPDGGGVSAACLVGPVMRVRGSR